MSNDLRAEIRRAERMKGDGPLVVAYITGGLHTYEWADSMFRLWGSRLAFERIHVRGGGRIGLKTSPRIAEARSQYVECFLTDPTLAEGEWLLSIDDDMTFAVEDVARLLELADPNEYPILGGLCFAGASPEGMYPTLYGAVRDEETGKYEVTTFKDIPDTDIAKVSATGAAFLLVHRKVLLAMRKAYAYMPDGQVNPYPWFAEGHVQPNGLPIGEDIAFCLRAGALGYPIHVDLRANIGHIKSVNLTRDLYKQVRDDH